MAAEPFQPAAKPPRPAVEPHLLGTRPLQPRAGRSPTAADHLGPAPQSFQPVAEPPRPVAEALRQSAQPFRPTPRPFLPLADPPRSEAEAPRLAAELLRPEVKPFFRRLMEPLPTEAEPPRLAGQHLRLAAEILRSTAIPPRHGLPSRLHRPQRHFLCPLWLSRCKRCVLSVWPCHKSPNPKWLIVDARWCSRRSPSPFSVSNSHPRS